MVPSLSVEDANSLIAMCHRGQLYAIQTWIDEQKCLTVPATMKKTPLGVAVDQGFHSLVELLVTHLDSQQDKNSALAKAVLKRRLDLVQLLVSHGADIHSVPFVDVLMSWEPNIARFFLDHNCDVITDDPFAGAFSEKIRTALGPYLDCKRRYPDFVPQLQEQADMALRQFCHDGNLKWVCLMMWAGANPRSLGFKVNDYCPDEDSKTTALKEACSEGRLEVLKKLKPDPLKDDFNELLRDSAFHAHGEVILFLLEHGSNPNDKPNGGSRALDHCVRHFRFENLSRLVFGPRTPIPTYEVTRTREAIKTLAEHGAIWKPDDRDSMREARWILLQLDPYGVSEFIQVLVKNNACFPETVIDLIRTPAMKRHLSGQWKEITRIAPQLEKSRCHKSVLKGRNRKQ